MANPIFADTRQTIPRPQNKNARRTREEAQRFISRRHPEYIWYINVCKWLLDTLEGGDRYRDAIYGYDITGRPLRNLIRQQREMPTNLIDPYDQWSAGVYPFKTSLDDQAAMTSAGDEVYDLRRARTPIPTNLSTYIEKMLAKIYKRSIIEELPPELVEWSQDIDGRHTTLNEWMHTVLAPLILAIGCIDVAFDHPHPDPDEPPFPGEDTNYNKRCFCQFILPENVLWWRLDYTGKYYLEVLILNRMIEPDMDEIQDRYVHWTTEDWTIYNAAGEIIDEGMHPYGIVPVQRLFDRRNYRYEHVPKSRLYGLADLQRAYYNEESEVIVSQTMHNCPIIQGPPDLTIDESPGDDTVPVGRNLVLKMGFDRNGNPVKYEYLTPNVANFQYARMRLEDLQTRMETEAAITRTLGSTGKSSSKGTGQSGVSKAFDQSEGSDFLSAIANTLEDCHYEILYMSMFVLHNGKPPGPAMDGISVIYPKEFNLLTFQDVAIIDETIQNHMNGPVGKVPTYDKVTLKMLVRKQHPDLPQDDLDKIDKEIDSYVDEQSKAGQNEKVPGLIPPGLKPFGPGGAGNGQPAVPLPSPTSGGGASGGGGQPDNLND